jgi:hypothetical protein
MRTFTLAFLLTSGCLAQVMSGAFVSSVTCTIDKTTVSSRLSYASGCNLTTPSTSDPTASASVSTWGSGNESVNGNVATLNTAAAVNITSAPGFGKLGGVATAAEAVEFSTSGPARDGFLSFVFDSQSADNNPLDINYITISDGVHLYMENGCYVSNATPCEIKVTDQPFLLGTSFWVMSYSHTALSESPVTGDLTGMASNDLSLSVFDSNGPVALLSSIASIPEPTTALLILPALVALGFARRRSRQMA